MITVAIEGVDGVGKETQAEILTARLEADGYKVHKESFPRYDTPIGKIIKEMLQQEYASDVLLHTLLEADRLQFMEVKQNIDADVLIYDRFTLSNLAYAVAKNVDRTLIEQLQTHIEPPDVNIVLYIKPEEAIRRRAVRGEALDIHEKDTKLMTSVGHIYNALCNYYDNAVGVDASKDVRTIADNIYDIVIRKVGEKSE